MCEPKIQTAEDPAEGIEGPEEDQENLLEVCLNFCQQAIEEQIAQVRGEGEKRIEELMAQWQDKFLNE